MTELALVTAVSELVLVATVAELTLVAAVVVSRLYFKLSLVANVA